MAKPKAHPRIAYLAWLLGSPFITLATPGWATTPDAVVAQVSAEVPPAVMLAQSWRMEVDPTGFLVSEKLDGVRAVWDGQTLRFRSGRVIQAPAWFIAALPATPLDGELWLGRRQFDRLSGVVRRQTPVDAEWRAVRYMVFDLPGDPWPFGERASHLNAQITAAKVPWLRAVEQVPGFDRARLQSALQKMVRDGGEGYMLHRADALWVPGRSDALQKLKAQPDEEARVVAHLPGKGRHAGRLGALLLEMPNGQRFALGTGFTDAQRSNPPPMGALVTYRYRERTPSGLPRFASFMRVRAVE